MESLSQGIYLSINSLYFLEWLSGKKLKIEDSSTRSGDNEHSGMRAR